MTPLQWTRCLSHSFHVKPHVNKLPSCYKQPTPLADDEIIVAMSAGVDSSVSAALFAHKYKNVRGIYMANWSQTAKCTEADWNDVQKVCSQLNIPCERVNFEKEYWTDVFTPMINMYEQGLTPNPDTGCNRYVKFGKMIEHLTAKFPPTKKWWLVTGHYARVMIHEPTQHRHLLRGYYGNKDQSFYLLTISPEVLDRVLFPIGHLTKPAVRQMAHDYKLHTANKPDSQGLCFVNPDHKFRDFLNEYIPPKPGNIVTPDGKVWGRHDGLWHATIGQKLGISMPQGDERYKGTWFVSEKRVDSNEIVIVKGGNHPDLYKRTLVVQDWHWLVLDPQAIDKANLTIQYRSLQEPEPVESFSADGDVTITLKRAARAMAAGQNVVLYNGPRVLGSGIVRGTH